MPLRPLIKAKSVTVTIRVSGETAQLVEDYAKHLGQDSTTSYVFESAARQVIASDKAFMASRASTRA